ncbi:SixA phosphatase family protein [Longibacter sp.]|uniref:SixA phosphatase family protein n=1 Tax=Longibacter sp. TaxID=2045415 RepID=UPI003EBE8BC4
MRVLFLQRHAQAESGAAYADDHQRELTDGGRRDAVAMGRHLARIGQVPAHVVCSSAVRTRETSEHLMQGADRSDITIESTDRLYQATPETVMEEIRAMNGGHGNGLLVGHQPAWGAVIQRLTGAQVDMRTGAIACIQLSVRSWSQVQSRSGRLVWFLPPMAVKGNGLQ